MTEDAGMVYSTRQAAEALGVGAAMMRRYAQTLEEVTGEEIPQTRRDGRQFSQEQLRTLLQAKALVDSNNGLSVEAALRMATQGEVEGLPVGLPRGIADSAGLVEVLREAVTGPIVAELREPNAALLFAALHEAVTRPLVTELRKLQADQNDTQLLRDEVASLRSELAAARALPPGANPERIDRALEVEMMESQVTSESPTAVEERQRDVKVVNGVEPQKLEQESWMAAVTLKTLAAASELPATPREKRGGESTGDAEGASDGPMVRAARWLERRFRGK